METTTILIILGIAVIGFVLYFILKKKGDKGPDLPKKSEEPKETPVSTSESPTPQGE